MAALKRRHGVISKGSEWPVVIEECINDVLIVCLATGTKIYRGILLDANKRNIPHGISFPFSHNGSGKSRKSPVATGDDDAQYESAATILRHSYYQQNSNHSENKTRSQNQNATTKPVSKIKLRPRQMLCSKCKASCYETDKGIVTMTGAPKQNAGKPNETMSSSTRLDLRSKRHVSVRDAKSNFKNVKSDTPVVRSTLNSCSTKPSVAVRPVVNLNAVKTENSIKSCSVSINAKPVCTKPSPVTVQSSPPKTSAVNVNTSKSTTINVNSIKTSTVNVSTSKNSTVNVNTSKTSTVNVNAVKSSTINLSTRASPFIKISIGEGTVVQIPPRIHGDEVDGGGSGEGGDTSQAEDTNVSAEDDSDDISIHRKIKKLTKKSKEREKSREDLLDIVEKSVEIESDQGITISSHHKKHKRKHKHKHCFHDDDTASNRDRDSSLEGFENENIDTSQSEVLSPSQRPRLLYTWRQNKGLSPRRDVSSINRTLSPRRDTSNSVQCNNDLYPEKEEESFFDPASQNSGIQKEYKLRSREKSQSMESLTEEDKSGSDNDSSYSLVSTQSSNENEAKLDESFEIDFHGCETNEDDNEQEEEEMEEGPPNDSNLDVFRPLMMKIQTREVNKCVTSDGRKIHVGDIVWGKIQGFPWWPGRVLSISTSQRDNGIVLRQLAHVSWFGSSTMSHIQCSDLYPFVEDFKVRYNKKKKGPYKTAIKQATIAAQSITNTHHIDFAEFDL